MLRRTEWLNSNAYRRYPFIPDSIMSASGLTLPDNAILDFRVSNYYLTPVDLSLINVELVDGGTKTAIFTFIYGAGSRIYLSVPETAEFPYSVTEATESHYVVCTFGEGVKELFYAYVPGEYDFSDALPKIEPVLLSFQLKHRVSKVTAHNDTGLTGLINAEEGFNCNLEFTNNDNSIRISALRGAGAGLYCAEDDYDKEECIAALKRINGLVAGDNGDFLLTAGSGVEIVPDQANNRIIIRGVKSIRELICKLCVANKQIDD